MNRDFLMLANTYTDEYIGGWYMSAKLDGMRALWDGGVSRGKKASEVPWANTEKDARLKDEVIATGLWSRYGKVVRAPDWWLDRLPKGIILDGELYAGCGRFQFVMSTVKDHVAGDGWTSIEYKVFDAPSPLLVFQDGKINNPNFKKQIRCVDCLQYFGSPLRQSKPFDLTYEWLTMNGETFTNEIVQVHKQMKLPYPEDEVSEIVEDFHDSVLASNGEGLMFRRPNSVWHPKRIPDLLKMKRLQDSEAIVTGYVSGEKTDKGSKLLGMMGALIVRWNNKEFQLSGFTDEERILGCVTGIDTPAREWAMNNPKTILPDWAEAVCFKRGTKVTFRYRELTDDGIPKEARFWRRYE